MEGQTYSKKSWGQAVQERKKKEALLLVGRWVPWGQLGQTSVEAAACVFTPSAPEWDSRHAELGSKRNFQRPLKSTGLIHIPCKFLLITVILIILIRRVSKAVGPYRFQVIYRVLWEGIHQWGQRRSTSFKSHMDCAIGAPEQHSVVGVMGFTAEETEARKR